MFSKLKKALKYIKNDHLYEYTAEDSSKDCSNTVQSGEAIIITSDTMNSSQENHDKNQNCILQTDTIPETKTVYYAVCMPHYEDDIELKNFQFVFTNKDVALGLVRTCREARFKAFTDEESAYKFAYFSNAFNVREDPSSDAGKTEKCPISLPLGPNNYRTPSREDIGELKRAVQLGDVESFRELVYTNPRFLISTQDTPRLLKEGSRYNALHVATFYRQPEICDCILEILSNDNFIQDFYQCLCIEESNIRSKARIIDCYLNMPEKALGETPLHFASKFGCLNSVKVLVSYRECDTTIQNKYGLTAREMICSREPQATEELKQQINDAFDALYYIPVMRTPDNSELPFLGKPVLYQELKLMKENCSLWSRVEHEPCIKACAGPMSQTKATQFHKLWKNPTRFSDQDVSNIVKIRLTDYEKGLERIGRQLALNMNTNWNEYWEFLYSWCDLSTTEGLEKLEQHLHDKIPHPRRNRFKVARKKDRRCYQFEKTSNVSELCYDFRKLLDAKTEDNTSEREETCLSSENWDISDKQEQLDTSQQELKQSPVDKMLEIQFTHILELFSDVVSCQLSLLDGIDQVFNKIQHILDSNETAQNAFTVKTLASEICSRIKQSHFVQDSHVLYSKLNLYFIYVYPNTSDDGSQQRRQAELVLNRLIKLLGETTTNLDSENSELEMSCANDSNCEDDLDLDALAADLNRKCVIETDSVGDTVSSTIDLEMKCDNESRALEIDLDRKCDDDSVGDTVSSTIDLEMKCDNESSALEIDLDRKCDNDSVGNRESSTLPTELDMKCDNDSESDINVSTTSEENFKTACCSPAESSSSNSDALQTPEEWVEVYIEGRLPSKADADVLRAIEFVKIDPKKYIQIWRWKHSVLMNDQKTIDSWHNF